LETIAIDEQGRLWEGTVDGVTCLSENTAAKDLFKKYEEDPNFKIVKIFRYESTYRRSNFAIDCYGKLWSWGDDDDGILGQDYTKYPKCLNDIEGSELANAKIEKVEFDYAQGVNVFAYDDDGNVYVWGRNYKGSLGNGNGYIIYEPYCINKSYAIGGKKIVDVKNNQYSNVVLCSGGTIYETGSSSTSWKFVRSWYGANR